MKYSSTVYLLILLLLSACGTNKTLFENNKVYEYINNQGKGKQHQVIEYTIKEKFRSEIDDRKDIYILKNVPLEKLTKTDSANIDGDLTGNFSDLENKFYTPETRKFVNGKQFVTKDLIYHYKKFALTGLTIPFKFRKGIGNDSINPPTVETGFNINFAPSYRLNWSFYNPSQKFLGSSMTNYSVTFGGLLGLAGTDLNNKTNATGLLSNRKSPTVTYGGAVLFGLNSFGFGYAIGFDRVLGEGSKYWVYQDKIWHGIIFSLDLIK